MKHIELFYQNESKIVCERCAQEYKNRSDAEIGDPEGIVLPSICYDCNAILENYED